MYNNWLEIYIFQSPCVFQYLRMESRHNISNGSIEFTPATFTLAGIPGLKVEYIWICIPFFLIYIIIFIGNGTILHIIRIESALHQPMYFFLAMLAFVKLGVSASTMPTVLGIFLFGIHNICFGGYLFQKFPCILLPSCSQVFFWLCL